MALSALLTAAAALPVTRAVEAQSDGGSIQQRLERLEAGVQAEEAVRAVKRLQHTYGHYAEWGLASDLSDLFTDDAIGDFQIKAAGDVQLKTAAVTGNARKFFMEADTTQGRVKGQLGTQMMLQPIVTLGADGRTAKGTWHYVSMSGQYGSSASWSGGIYENEYTFEKGVWKISRLRQIEQYSGAYEEYGHKAPPKWNVPYHFEAAHVGVTIPQSARQPRTTAASAAAAGDRLAELARRVQRLHDETQVQNLQHSYGYYMDRKLWDDVSDLFADDGTLELDQRGAYIGRPRIRKALETFYGPHPLRTGELFDHITLQTVVTFGADGRSASARASQLSQIGVSGEYARWELGIYENQFVKQDGVWKIKAVRYYPRLVTDYDKGWAVSALPAATASADFPPDPGAVQAYASYPDVHYVGFHYVNPVTGREVQYPRGRVTRVQVVRPPRGGSRQASTVRDSAILETMLTDVERRLEAAIGVDATENLNSSYGYYIDESAWDQMADTFAVTAGAKEITGAGTYVGRDRIRKVLNLRGPQGGRTPNFFTIHQLTQPVIHVSEDGKSAKARLRLFQLGGNADGSSGSWIGGVYENTAVFEDGEWKFGVQDLHHIFNASYRNGWARVGAPAAARGNAAPGGRAGQPVQPAATPTAPGAAAPAPGRTGRDVPGGGIQQGLGGAASPARFVTEFPPDRPIRARQYAFPQIVEPAFHYKNPVSGRMPAELLP
jgi:hypothetical protein